MRKTQRFISVGTLNQSVGDGLSTPIDFRVLKNCLIDKRLGAPTRRPGSLTETIASSLGRPISIAEHLSNSASSLIPLTSRLLANFGGTAFKKRVAGTWSSVTSDSNNSFSSSKPGTYAQIGEYVHLAWGRLAKWNGTGNLDRVGIPKPVSAATTATTGTGISAVTGWQYIYTYYNPSTGLESDWSPVSANTGPVTNKTITVTTPTTTPSAPGATVKRIYRTLDGGSDIYYYVDELSTGTADYSDSTPDEDLAQECAPLGDYDLPPTSYIIAKYASRYWVVDSNDPHILRFSKGYTGSSTDLEYYPTQNYLNTTEPITGLYVVPNRLLLFHPRSISVITGTNEESFQVEPFRMGVGTLFSNAIASNGEWLVFLAEQGMVAMQGGDVLHISREIDMDLQNLLNKEYNANLYASIVWNPSLRQFIFSIAAISTSGSPWEFDSGGVGEWVDSDTGATETWEDPDSSSTDNTTRVKIFGWSPELSRKGKDEGLNQNRWMEYSFHWAEDLNQEGATPICMIHPQPSSDTLDPQQDKTYIGYYDGTEGQIVSCFRRDRTKDDSTTFTAKLLTGRITPGEDTGGYKRVKGIQFAGDYADPTSDGLATLKYIKDYDDPQLRGYVSQLITISDVTDVKRVPKGKLRFMNIEITDTSDNPDKVLLQEFTLHYSERKTREGR